MSETGKAAAAEKKTTKKTTAKKSAATAKKVKKVEAPPLELHNLQPPSGAVKSRKRLGQGEGSGTGRQSGRGHKGQLSRSGYSRRIGFEGGQMPLIRRLPKRGFHNIFRTEYAEVNVGRLEALGVKEITPELLVERRVVRNLKDGVKILGNGEIKKALKVKVHAISEGARKKIEAAGGKVELIRTAAPAKNKAAAAKAEVTE